MIPKCHQLEELSFKKIIAFWRQWGRTFTLNEQSILRHRIKRLQK